MNIEIGTEINGKKIEKILKTFAILWDAWELDSTGYICQFTDGTKGAVSTNHGIPYLMKKIEMLNKIEVYKRAISLTEEAIAQLDS